MCVILGFWYKITDEDTEHYLSSNVWMFVIYDKGNSHCQIYNFCVVVCFRKTRYGDYFWATEIVQFFSLLVNYLNVVSWYVH